MSRHERDFRASAEEPLNAEDLAALVGVERRTGGRARQDAIACYLSASEGWREARKKLGGAFAKPNAGLKEVKPD